MFWADTSKIRKSHCRHILFSSELSIVSTFSSPDCLFRSCYTYIHLCNFIMFWGILLPLMPFASTYPSHRKTRPFISSPTHVMVIFTLAFCGEEITATQRRRRSNIVLDNAPWVCGVAYAALLFSVLNSKTTSANTSRINDTERVGDVTHTQLAVRRRLRTFSSGFSSVRSADCGICGGMKGLFSPKYAKICLNTELPMAASPVSCLHLLHSATFDWA